MPFLIRDFKRDDLPAMQEIDRLSFRADEQYGEDVYAAVGQEPHLRTLVAVEGDAVFGYALLDLAVAPARLRSLAVHPECRNRGCGRKLLEYCLNRFNQSVDLFVRQDNSTAIRLYEALGFVRAESQDAAEVPQGVDRYVRW